MWLVYPGRTAREINARLSHVLDDEQSDYTVILAATNNIESDSITKCKSELKNVVDNVARMSQRRPVIFCQIPKRYDDVSLNSKIDAVNRYLSHLVSRHGHLYLLKHDVDASDYRDGLHFNKKGTAKFAHEIRHMINNCRHAQTVGKELLIQ